jgi:arylsulfatase A-like enzyme
MLEEARGTQALRRGPWKYISASQPRRNQEAKGPELYNLDDDSSETQNVIADYPEIAESMAQELQEFVSGKSVRIGHFLKVPDPDSIR